MQRGNLSRFGVLALAAFLGACNPARTVRPTVPSAYAGQAQYVDRTSVFVVDWDPTQISALDGSIRGGAPVAVALRGRRFQMLRDCHIQGMYRQAPRQPAYGGRLQLRDLSSSDLGAGSMPGQERQLSAALSAGTSLDYDYVIAGRFDWLAAGAPTLVTLADQAPGACQGATHFVRTAYLGAFQRTGASGASVAGGISLGGLGASTASASQATLAAQGGDYARCVSQRYTAAIPPECTALLKVDLEAIRPGSVDLVFDSYYVQGQQQPQLSFRLTTPRAFVGQTQTFGSAAGVSGQMFPGVEVTDSAPLSVDVYNTAGNVTQPCGHAVATIADVRKGQFAVDVYYDRQPTPIGNVRFRVVGLH